jgi:hypothetical protein
MAVWQLAFASLLRFTNFESDSTNFWTTSSFNSIVLSGLTSADGWSRLAVAILGVGERGYE